MKKFTCGDVVPGCTASFSGKSEDDILAKVAVHAREAHGIQKVSADLVSAVKQKIRNADHG